MGMEVEKYSFWSQVYNSQKLGNYILDSNSYLYAFSIKKGVLMDKEEIIAYIQRTAKEIIENTKSTEKKQRIAMLERFCIMDLETDGMLSALFLQNSN